MTALAHPLLELPAEGSGRQDGPAPVFGCFVWAPGKGHGRVDELFEVVGKSRVLRLLLARISFAPRGLVPPGGAGLAQTTENRVELPPSGLGKGLRCSGEVGPFGGTRREAAPRDLRFRAFRR